MRPYIALIPLLALGGCVTDSVSQDAIGAAQATITAYADIYQPAVLAYGRLPVCPQAVLCHDAATFGKLKAIDAAVTQSITAAQSVLEGKTADSGQISAALTAIQSAEATIASSGVMSGK